MTAIDIVRQYLEVATPGSLDPDRVRPLLADDYSVEDPLMPVSGADAFVDKLRSVAGTPGDAGGTVEAVVGDEGIVCALTRFQAGPTTIWFSQWFWVEDGKIARSRVIYDPRAFLAMRPPEA